MLTNKYNCSFCNKEIELHQYIKYNKCDKCVIKLYEELIDIFNKNSDLTSIAKSLIEINNNLARMIK